MENEDNTHENHSLFIWVIELHTDENHDWFSKQDPLVKIVILNKNDETAEYEETFAFKTPTKDEGGTDVSWDRDNGSCRVFEQQIRADTLVSFIAYDRDLFSKETIGETSPLNVSQLKTNSAEIPRKINIHDSNQENNGWVKVMMKWE